MKTARPVLVAEFGDRDVFVSAARRAHDDGFAIADALTPCPVEEIEEIMGLPTSPVRWPMLIAGLAVAAFAYGLEFWSATSAYPIDSGGRPTNSWPIFLLVPFEVGVLAAAIAGFIAFLLLCGLPRLNHPLFDLGAVERATDDRYVLVLEEPHDDDSIRRLRALLVELTALSVSEASA
jgi:Protein of unknown function (DUF3341)